MSISQNFPTSSPSLSLDFANVKKLDPRVTFARATTGAYFDANGLLRTASANVARFDHNPVTGESLGLLVEEQRSNLLLRSEEFGNAAWSKSNVTVDSDVVVAPDGTLTGNKVVENTTSAVHVVAQNLSVTSGTTYTVSGFIKKAERGFALIALINGFPTTSIQINLTTGVVSTGTGTPLNAFSQDVGNGWFRVGFSLVANSTTNAAANFYTSNNGEWATRIYLGDGYSGIFIWGASLEQGAFPTSYIPTVASQVTRSADSASMTGTNFSEWYRADEGTLYADYVATQTNIGTVVSVASTGNTNPLGIFENWAGTNVRVGIPAVAFLDSSGVAITANTQYKTAFAIKSGDFASSTNASTVQTSSGDYPSYVNNAISLTIGGPSSAGSFQYVNSTIKKLAYYPARLTNEQLQALTS